MLATLPGVVLCNVGRGKLTGLVANVGKGDGGDKGDGEVHEPADGVRSARAYMPCATQEWIVRLT